MTCPWFEWRGRDLLLRLHVQPRASRPGVAGVHGERLKVRLSSPPVEGAANEELLALLAREFGLPKSHLELATGATGRDKVVLVRQPAVTPAWLSGESQGAGGKDSP